MSPTTLLYGNPGSPQAMSWMTLRCVAVSQMAARIMSVMLPAHGTAGDAVRGGLDAPAEERGLVLEHLPLVIDRVLDRLQGDRVVTIDTVGRLGGRLDGERDRAELLRDLRHVVRAVVVPALVGFALELSSAVPHRYGICPVWPVSSSRAAFMARPSGRAELRMRSYSRFGLCGMVVGSISIGSTNPWRSSIVVGSHVLERVGRDDALGLRERDEVTVAVEAVAVGAVGR